MSTKIALGFETINFALDHGNGKFTIQYCCPEFNVFFSARPSFSFVNIFSSVENVANLFKITELCVQYLFPDGSDGPAAENVCQDANCGNNRHACAPHDSGLYKPLRVEILIK
jgi:hypothetical protein